MVRAMLLAALTALTPSVPGSATPAADVPSPAVVTTHWSWPLAPRPAVARPFRVPPTPWGAGHRGLDLAAAAGQPVLAAGTGRVTFAGMVAGRGVVVVTHPNGWRTTYEPLVDRAHLGTEVVTGSPIGLVGASGSHCRPAVCLHWGLRRGALYGDPLALLGLGPVVLLPMT